MGHSYYVENQLLLSHVLVSGPLVKLGHWSMLNTVTKAQTHCTLMSHTKINKLIFFENLVSSGFFCNFGAGHQH